MSLQVKHIEVIGYRLPRKIKKHLKKINKGRTPLWKCYYKRRWVTETK